MIKAIAYEIERAIPELMGRISPTHAPVGEKKPPYLVYYKNNSGRIKTLDGYASDNSLGYMFSIMTVRYEDMQMLTDKVAELLITLVQTRIGEGKEAYVADLTINDIDETYEENLKLERGIIDFTIYY